MAPSTDMEERVYRWYMPPRCGGEFDGSDDEERREESDEDEVPAEQSVPVNEDQLYGPVESTVRDPCSECTYVDNVYVHPCPMCYVYHGITTNMVYHGCNFTTCGCEFCEKRRDWMEVLSAGRHHHMLGLIYRMKRADTLLDDCGDAFSTIINNDLVDMEQILENAVQENYENRRDRMEEENQENSSPPARRRRVA